MENEFKEIAIPSAPKIDKTTNTDNAPKLQMNQWQRLPKMPHMGKKRIFLLFFLFMILLFIPFPSYGYSICGIGEPGCGEKSWHLGPSLLARAIQVVYFSNNQELQYKPPTFSVSPQTPTSSITPIVTKSQWKTYTNTTYDFSFQYPPEYKIDEDESKYALVVLTKNAIDTKPLTLGPKLIKGVRLYINVSEIKSEDFQNPPKEYRYKPVFISGKSGYKQVYAGQELIKSDDYFLFQGSKWLQFSAIHGYESTDEENEKYTDEFHRILWTLKFLKYQEPYGFIVIAWKNGGLCPTGECMTNYAITGNGAVLVNNQIVKQLTYDEDKELRELINKTNFERIMATPFTGTCPTAYDGVELKYEILKDTVKSVSTCQFQIDRDEPLFIRLNELFSINN